jgi:hypothetical protein
MRRHPNSHFRDGRFAYWLGLGVAFLAGQGLTLLAFTDGGPIVQLSYTARPAATVLWLGGVLLFAVQAVTFGLFRHRWSCHFPTLISTRHEKDNGRRSDLPTPVGTKTSGIQF